MTFRKIIASAALLIASTAAFTAPVQAERLLVQKGDWSVTEALFPDEPTANLCYAESFSGAYLRLHIFGYPGNEMEIVAWDDRWKLQSRPLTWVISVDGVSWPLDGKDDYNNVSAKMSDRALAKGVLRMIAEGNRLAVQNLAGKNLASYSLRGSSAAMSAFTDCWNRLQPADEVKSDPFVDDQSDQTVKDTFD
jgi:hypothetical protein